MCLLPPAYVVRREGNVLTRVCPSICLSTGGGSVQPGGGSVQPGGGSVQLAGGGVSPAGGGQSSQQGGSVQPGGGGQVLTTRWAVCLLRSRRRTFLY